ncbi:MAG TPA: zf-HC2 domain-containing protein [Actinomycetota bacterium]|nr:zf-HC2 domain-containing protein [Actinomycetota bacterium]
MNCLSIREQLPEFAVGVLPPEERIDVERHLQWCAGCRKEAGDLGEAAATFGLALRPVDPPGELADRVVSSVARASAKPGSKRRLRAVAASTVAAAVAVAGLGWGAVMAGRAERFGDRAVRAERQKAAALARFKDVLGPHGLAQLPQDHTVLGQLAPVSPARVGSGWVLQLLSPAKLDFVMVILNGIDAPPSDLPFQVQLRNAAGQTLNAGKITSLDADGGAEAYRRFANKDLTGFTNVIVTDAHGDVVLRGTVDQSAGG